MDSDSISVFDSPSIQQQKDFIIKNAEFLSKRIKEDIIYLVLMEMGESSSQIITENIQIKEVCINLDMVENKNVDILKHIYNIVLARIQLLDKPAVDIN